jgi:hypothetical protein
VPNKEQYDCRKDVPKNDHEHVHFSLKNAFFGDVTFPSHNIRQSQLHFS